MGIGVPDWWDFNAAQNGVFRGEQIVIFTVNGAGVTLWDGYSADMARALCNNFPWFYFQPIGYDSKPAPMKPGITQGTAEFVRLLLEVYPTGKFVGIFYSEGAIIGANVLDILRDPTSPLAHRYEDFIAAVTFGNPRREEHSVAPSCIDPGGFGIVTPNTVDTPSWWWNFANGPTVPGAGGWDLYTTCCNAKEGSVQLKDMRNVWKTIYSGNPLSLFKMIGSSLLPWNWVGAFKAAGSAAKFFGSATLPHVDYSVSYPILGDPRDCWRVGFDYLVQVGLQASRPVLPPPSPSAPDAPPPVPVPVGPLFPPIRS